ncbi:MAG: secondary thiamine-phosphate synthase enzyme YjbQ [Spirochaetes bacterium]|nr:secondary thiamine-phosphate synthase enzyme YjbQ [Spirochaetota bacterium]
MVYQKEITISSSAFDAIYDITSKVQNVIRESSIQNGIVNVFNIGSTASITTIEFEPGLQKDFPQFLNKILPRGIGYHHDNTWGDGNGDGHLKASLIGPQITCPVNNANVVLGTWQQIILVDSDNKPRNRRILITVIGE